MVANVAPRRIHTGTVGMKMKLAIPLIAVVFLGCSSSPSRPGPVATSFLPGAPPAGWTVAVTADARQFKPVRGLANPIVQVTLTDSTAHLHREFWPGRSKTFHPNIVLLVFPVDDLGTVENAVRKESKNSDCPPMVFGASKTHVFVTSPGYVNGGLHAPEAEAKIQALKDSLRRSMEIR